MFNDFRQTWVDSNLADKTLIANKRNYRLWLALLFMSTVSVGVAMVLNWHEPPKLAVVFAVFGAMGFILAVDFWVRRAIQYICKKERGED